MGDKLLEIRNLSASYSGPDAISEINLSMDSGEILCIVGESGSGKSSLIKAIHGLSDIKITCGCVKYGGRDITEPGSAGRYGLMGEEIALIPQNPEASFNPIRRLDVQLRETLSAHEMEYDEEETGKRLIEIGITDGAAVLGNRPFELSGGMNQRIAIAVAMMLEPRLLLCDEPTSALDVTTAGAVVNELMKIREQGGTAILMATHHLGIAKRMADRIAIMKDGRIVEYDRAEKIFAEPEHEYTRNLLRDVPRLRK